MTNTGTTATAQIGVTGLAVMGSNIARNFARHGYIIALHNRSVAKTDALLAKHGADGNFVHSETIPEFLAALEKPRRVLIMGKAGDPTDAVINELADPMEEGDIIIDGGNALYTDTSARAGLAVNPAARQRFGTGTTLHGDLAGNCCTRWRLPLSRCAVGGSDVRRSSSVSPRTYSPAIVR